MGNLIIDGKAFENFEIPNLMINVDGEADAPMWRKVTPIISADAEMSFECETILNPNAMRALLGLDLAPGPDNYISSMSFLGKGIKQMQIRKHRKKRINKKWAKRYGYKTVFTDVKIDGVSLVECDDPCEGVRTFEFVGRCG